MTKINGKIGDAMISKAFSGDSVRYGDFLDVYDVLHIFLVADFTLVFFVRGRILIASERFYAVHVSSNALYSFAFKSLAWKTNLGKVEH